MGDPDLRRVGRGHNLEPELKGLEDGVDGVYHDLGPFGDGLLVGARVPVDEVTEELEENLVGRLVTAWK